ncbi:MAG: Mu transposase domain-containing protein [Acidimicrobiales bacterium]
MLLTARSKARVERTVAYVRGSFFAGEDFADLADAQRRAEAWCRTTAGQRVHGTTCRRPAEVFAAEEASRLLPAPALPYDLPVYAQPKVARDHHVEVAKALYSVPGHLIGRRIEARADAQLVKLFWRGALIKVPASPPEAAPLTPTTCPRSGPTMPCETSATCAARPTRMGPRSGSTPAGCWRSTSRGPGCGRSTGCWATPAATATAAARSRVLKPSPSTSSMSG